MNPARLLDHFNRIFEVAICGLSVDNQSLITSVFLGAKSKHLQMIHAALALRLLPWPWIGTSGGVNS